MLQQTIAIFLVLGLLSGALWLLKRQGVGTIRLPTNAKRRRMHVIERVVLTSQHSLHLVTVDGRLLVFAVSPAGCQAVEPSIFPVSAPHVNDATRSGAASC